MRGVISHSATPINFSFVLFLSRCICTLAVRMETGSEGTKTLSVTWSMATPLAAELSDSLEGNGIVLVNT